MRRIIVIGAGASGLMAAITAAREGAAVTVLEGMEKPGKKLLMTGNGRCNLTNTDQEREDCLRGAARPFLRSVMEQFPLEKTLAFFEELGLLLQVKEGYVYPYVNQASAVLDVLLLEAKRLRIKIKCMEKVNALWREDGLWNVQTAGWTYQADAVILSAGSMAAPKTGSDGSGYRLAGQCGHTIIRPLEALVPLNTKESWVKKLAGLRTQAEVTLRVEDAEKKNGKGSVRTYMERGELQWTEYGLSGIVIFQLSRYAVRALAEGKKITAAVDLMPQFSKKELEELFVKRKKDGSLEEFLTGILPKKAIPALLSLLSLRPSDLVKEQPPERLNALADKIKCLEIGISGHKSFDMAQVCSGGVDTAQVREGTLESALLPGLYFTGEILDVDGICGGYNLQWAWSSGYAAGLHSARS